MIETPTERQSFLPDFCHPASLLRTLLIAQLLVFILVAVHPGGLQERLHALALTTLFVQWIAVVDVALLCALRRHLTHLDDRVAAAIAFVLLQVVTIAVALVAHGITGLMALPVVSKPLPAMLVEYTVVSAIVTAVGLRYFYVTAEWQRNLQAESQARVQALQARIRPHFLFNSMNTIASLTRSDPIAAERAVEDLSELFRATLAEQSLRTLDEELEFVASYLRIEALRLGARLVVEWDLDPVAGRAVVPAMTLQPLLENAVYHGIEAQPGGGTVRITTRCGVERVRLVVENPSAQGPGRVDGHRLAQDNIRQRLELAFGDAAVFRVEEGDSRYRVVIEVPIPEHRSQRDAP